MSILKREMAPITTESWEEIDLRAKEVLNNVLSARKSMRVLGPKGWSYTAVPEGKLKLINDKTQSVGAGIFKLKPLVESRVTFELDRWELDNLTRGAKFIDLTNLEHATKKIALFEENAVYKGYKNGDITGLENIAKHELTFGNNASGIMASISEALFLLKEAYVEPPYSLILGREGYKRLNSVFEGYPLINVIKNIIGGEVILSEVLDGAFLIPFNNENLEITIGQDFSIGYLNHDDKKIKFFISETFTFRILDDEIIVKFNM